MKNRDEAKLVNTGWAQMKATLDEVMPEEKKKPIFLPYFIGLGGVITIFGLWLLLNRSQNSVVPTERNVENLKSPSIQNQLQPETQATTPSEGNDNSDLVLIQPSNDGFETKSSFLKPKVGPNIPKIQKSNTFINYPKTSSPNLLSSEERTSDGSNTITPSSISTLQLITSDVAEKGVEVYSKNNSGVALSDFREAENKELAQRLPESEILQLPFSSNLLRYDQSFDIPTYATITAIQPENKKIRRFSFHTQAQLGSSSLDRADVNYAAGLAVKWKLFKKLSIIPSLMVAQEKYNTNFVYTNGQYRLANKGTHNGDSRDNQNPPFEFIGAEYSNLSVSNGYYLTYNTQILMSAGLNVGYALSKKWAFETGINYTYTSDEKNTYNEISNALNYQSTGANNQPPTALYTSKSYQPIRYNFGMYYSPARWLEVGLTFQRAVRPLIEISQNQNRVSSVNPPFLGLNARVKIF